MAKRSPILGYNHNVRYRGLVFHVQTEDSGLLSPHLFTHLFHAGVIISTRKLVYDAGSAEDSIKSLMQAQHKAVMKDLKRGLFDDKIDAYLGSTPGLLPRGTGSDVVDAEEPRLAKPSEPMPPLADHERSRRASEGLPLGLKPTRLDVSSEVAASRTITPVRVSPPRTKTAERTSPPSAVRTSLPPPAPMDFDPPTETSSPGAVADAIYGVTAPVEQDFAEDSSPEIEIQLELADDDEPAVPRVRSHRDTDLVTMPDDQSDETRRHHSDGIPGALTGQVSATVRSDAAPSLPPPAQSDRKVSLGAASLPPARPISRPPSRPAFSPPQVTSRPVERTDDRAARESDAVEVYAPAPPSAELPGVAGSERPGQYSQHSRRPLQKTGEQVANKSGAIPIPSGLAKPRRMQSPSSSQPLPSGVPAPIRDAGSAGTSRTRTPTPSRVNPTPNRAGTNSTGVVMTRPAVIVGAPPKPQSTTQRVRKAREEEGRGFGQGLISEKSLDEVILAYLSEDADDNK